MIPSTDPVATLLPETMLLDAITYVFIAHATGPQRKAATAHRGRLGPRRQPRWRAAALVLDPGVLLEMRGRFRTRR